MKHIGLAAALLLLLGVSVALIADAAAGEAEAKALAKEYQRRADSLQEQVDDAWKAYTALGDTLTVKADSLDSLRHEAAQAASEARSRVDTLTLMVPDTGDVPRELHDGIVRGLEDVIEATAKERDAALEQAVIWRRRWAAADSGWAQEREVNALLRQSVEKWRKAADPGFFDGLKRNAGTVGVALLAGAAVWEVVR